MWPSDTTLSVGGAIGTVISMKIIYVVSRCQLMRAGGAIDRDACSSRLVGTDFEPESVQFYDRGDDTEAQSEAWAILASLGR